MVAQSIAVLPADHHDIAADNEVWCIQFACSMYSSPSMMYSSPGMPKLGGTQTHTEKHGAKSSLAVGQGEIRSSSWPVSVSRQVFRSWHLGPRHFDRFAKADNAVMWKDRRQVRAFQIASRCARGSRVRPHRRDRGARANDRHFLPVASRVWKQVRSLWHEQSHRMSL